jgi:hypothetical protein
VCFSLVAIAVIVQASSRSMSSYKGYRLRTGQLFVLVTYFAIEAYHSYETTARGTRIVVLEACASFLNHPQCGSTAGASIAQERLMEVTGDVKSFQEFAPKTPSKDPRLTVWTVDVTLCNQTRN